MSSGTVRLPPRGRRGWYARRSRRVAFAALPVAGMAVGFLFLLGWNYLLGLAALFLPHMAAGWDTQIHDGFHRLAIFLTVLLVAATLGAVFDIARSIRRTQQPADAGRSPE